MFQKKRNKKYIYKNKKSKKQKKNTIKINHVKLAFIFGNLCKQGKNLSLKKTKEKS